MEQEDFTSTTYTNLLDNSIISPERGQQPIYTRLCGVDEEFRVNVKDKMSHRKVLRGD